MDGNVYYDGRERKKLRIEFWGMFVFKGNIKVEKLWEFEGV